MRRVREERRAETPPTPCADALEDTWTNSQVSTTSSQSTSRRLESHSSQSGPWNAPVARITITETSGQTYGFGAKDAESRQLRLCDEAKDKILGPMPVNDFLRDFLKRDTIDMEDMPSSDGAFNEVPHKATTERMIYQPMVRPHPRLLAQGCVYITIADHGPERRAGNRLPLPKVPFLRHI